MARLEIELDAKVSKAEKAISGVSEELLSLEKQYSKTALQLKKFNEASMRYQSALDGIKKELQSGVISQEEYIKKAEEAQRGYDYSAGKAKELGIELRDLKIKLDDVAESGGKTGRSVKVVGQQMGGATQSLSRQVFAQRAALSASNNLTRAMTALGSNTGSAASSFGVFGRQLALLSTSGGMSMKGLIASFSGPAGIAIAVSVAVTAITGFINNLQKAKRAAKEAKEDLDAYSNSLQNLIRQQEIGVRVSNDGARASSNEIAHLEALKIQIEDEANSREKRVSAIREIQRIYPKYFKGLNDEKILAGQVTAQYAKLTAQIMATGKARAAERLMASEYDKIEAIDLKRILRLEKIERINTRINKKTNELSESLKGWDLDFEGIVQSEEKIKDLFNLLTTAGGRVAKTNKAILKDIVDAQKEIQDIKPEREEDFNEYIKATQNVKKLSESIRDSVRSEGKLFDEAKERVGGYTRQMIDYAQKLQDVFDKGERSVDKTGLVGLDIDVEKTRQKYESLYVQISKIEKAVTKDRMMNEQEKSAMLAMASKIRTDTVNNEADEQMRNVVDYEEKTQAQVEQILRDGNVSLIKTREQELEINENKYKKLIEMHKHNGDLVDAYNEARRSREEAINEKWNLQLTTITIEQTRRLHEKKSQMMTRQINDEFRMRVKQANKDIQTEEARLKKQLELQQEYYERLDAIKKFEEMESAALQFGDAVGSAFSSMLTDGTNVFQSLVKEFKKAVTQMIAQAVALNAANLFGKLLNIGTVATGGGIFGNIFKKLIGSGGFGGGGIPRNRMAMASTGTDMMMASAQTKSQGNLVSSVNNGTFTGDGNNSVASSGGMKIEVKMDDVRLSGSDLLLSQKRESKKQHRFYNT